MITTVDCVSKARWTFLVDGVYIMRDKPPLTARLYSLARKT